MAIKKLLVDAHTFDENHQGIRTFLKGVYSAIKLDSEDLEIILVANDIDNLQEEFKHQTNFKYIKLKHTNKYIRLAYEFPKIIRENKIDFAHFNYFLPLFLSKKCQYIVTIHDVLFVDFPQFFPLKYQIINTLLYKRSAYKAKFVTTVSKYSADMIRLNFKIPNKTITILPNATSPQYLENHDKNADKQFIKENYQIENFIIYVSRIEPRKNHLMVVQAYHELELWNKGVALVFIGKETFKINELEDKIHEVNSISNNMITRLEDINNEELIKFYNAAELAVFPSLCEGFGIPPIESAILKTPTLCSNATAMSDFDFFDEYLFDASSKEVFKSKIETVVALHDPDRLMRISQTIKQRYDWNKTAAILKKTILSH